MINEILENFIKENVPTKEVALLLSGGVDSLTLGFAATEVGKKVKAYTFQVGEWKSEDAVYAEEACKLFGWEFNLIKVPVDKLIPDLTILKRELNCTKKTHYECTWPFLYVYPEIDEEFVLSGVGSDGHHGMGRKAQQHWNVINDRSMFNAYRKDRQNSENPAAKDQQELLGKMYGCKVLFPYFSDQVAEYFLKFSWRDLNRPIEKQKLITAYPEYYSKIHNRKHSNLQLNSGIDRIFNGLLRNLNINKKKRTRVLDLIGDINKDERI